MTNFHCAYIAARHRAEREQKIRNAWKLLALMLVLAGLATTLVIAC